MRDITIVPQDYIATYTKTDTVMKKFDDGCEVYEVIEDRKPLVRCKDCKWSDWYMTLNGEHRCYCMEHGSLGHTDDDFCSYGEREDGEE